MEDSSLPVWSDNRWKLVTVRLTLRRLTTTDAPFMLALLNSPSWLRFIGNRNVHTLDEARQYIENGALKSYKLHALGSYLVTLSETGQPIGTCGLHQREDLPDVDIGFAFLPSFEGKGYGYEAASAVVKYAIDTLQLQRLTARCNPENEASIALIEKLGFQYEKHVEYPPQQKSLQYSLTL